MAEDKAPFDWLNPGTPAEGWEGINGESDADPRAAAYDAAMKRFEEAQLVSNVFMNARGPELLERLRQQLFEQPLIRLTGTLGLQEEMEISLTPEQWAFVREGQNSVLRYFLRMINEAMGGPPAPPRVDAPPSQTET